MPIAAPFPDMEYFCFAEFLLVVKFDIADFGEFSRNICGLHTDSELIQPTGDQFPERNSDHRIFTRIGTLFAQNDSIILFSDRKRGWQRTELGETRINDQVRAEISSSGNDDAEQDRGKSE